MRITQIRHLTVPLRGSVANAVVSFDRHTVSLVAVVSDVVRNGRPLTGVAFDSIGRYAQGGILDERMIPRVLSAAPDALVGDAGLIDPALVLNCMLTDEKPGGHGDRAAAAAAVELACWDLLAKYHDEPAHKTIARALGTTPHLNGAPVYSAGGYYRADGGVAELRDEVVGYLETGYTAVKIKIGGAPLRDDIARIEAAVDAAGAGERVAVDANGRFDVTQALQYAEALAPFDLRWYEEPVDPLDYAALHQIAETYPGALATGENLFSARDTANLLRYAGLRPSRDVLQMDAGLSYGLTEYARMIELMESFGFPRSAAMPHGGHLLNLHIVTALGLGGCEAYPGVFAPFGGYSADCLLSEGRIHPSDAPGFGLERKADLAADIERLMS